MLRGLFGTDMNEFARQSEAGQGIEEGPQEGGSQHEVYCDLPQIIRNTPAVPSWVPGPVLYGCGSAKGRTYRGYFRPVCLAGKANNDTTG